jgi:intermediate peptidase
MYFSVSSRRHLLWQVLHAVLHDPEIVKSLSQEALQTALIFWHDFEKSAIKLPPEQRERFVSLSSEILSVGHAFVTEASAPRPPVKIKPSELEGLKDRGMGTRLQRQAFFTQKELLVYPGSHQAYMILRAAPDEEPRRKVYMAGHVSSAEQIDRLERLLNARAQLSRLVGWDSYAGMTLSDKMAKTPGERLCLVACRPVLIAKLCRKCQSILGYLPGSDHSRCS